MSGTFKEKAVGELLTVLPVGKREVSAFVAGVARAAGSLHLSNRRKNLVFTLSSYAECLALVGLLKTLYPAEFEVSVEHIRSGVRKGGTNYTVAVPTGFTTQALEDIGMFGEEGSEPLPESVITERASAEAFLKGLFLGCGSVYVPSASEGEKRDGYHFEFALDSESLADSVAALLRSFGINPKISERGQSVLVYLKDKDEILRALALLGLADCVLSLKAVIDERETANSINRATICETANLDKTYTASSAQIAAINKIRDTVGLEALSPVLRETAVERERNGLAPMAELAEILGVTKSCLNHRLRKIKEIADELNGATEI